MEFAEFKKTYGYDNDIRYLRLLRHRYPNINSASEEIINLQAQLNLPKGTEHFLSDIHGEYESFTHILKNASGVIKSKIDNVFSNTLTEAERKTLATLIYYPEEKLALVKETTSNMNEWYHLTLYHLIEVCKVSASKYTREAVRQSLPKGFGYIIDELLHAQDDARSKDRYYREIIHTIIRIGQADAFITAMSHLIQRLSIARLHIIGDIYDRGPGAAIIMDTLMQYHSIDIQWGNHDIVWMGAARGNTCCIANVIRNSARYDNMDTIEEAYGINLRPLAVFAMQAYGNDPCSVFIPKHIDMTKYSKRDEKLIAKIHKAITVIQFKLEGQMILRHPEYKMQNRLLLDKIDPKSGTVNIEGKNYPLTDTTFPTIDFTAPYSLSAEEAEVVERLKTAFMHSQRLKQHVQFLHDKGSIYNRYNSNLMFHGCIPMTRNGNFATVILENTHLKGKRYLDAAERLVRQGFSADTPQQQTGIDFMWYLWCGPQSPLFGKNKAATFEQYFVANKDVQTETKNAYYACIEKKETCIKILQEFHLDPETSHIINGHVPVEIKKGQSPIKAEGKLLVIDGGLSKGYQPRTGIAGYTLLYNSHGLILASHEPFESRQKAIIEEIDIHSNITVLETTGERILIGDTDAGMELKEQIHDLELLLAAYREGILSQRL
ncbi:fructose-1,6-bisphosphatase [Ructibacterium gallinarum]|uniref:Fructose-1,6-bisphosphatase class 3 n=1 Tax=Ructibacterium gallinarum TaxID=2779355 RepID=A0A9D5RCA2_9FIRM|nr:fructose-1,6-bisphosphatase [Ructibacterium gallinarum]MBE5040813.1 fructose-1,6-bisphosphatase [Ructibacterium gallinarum]